MYDSRNRVESMSDTVTGRLGIRRPWCEMRSDLMDNLSGSQRATSPWSWSYSRLEVLEVTNPAGVVLNRSYTLIANRPAADAAGWAHFCMPAIRSVRGAFARDQLQTVSPIMIRCERPQSILSRAPVGRSARRIISRA
jgi:hypothetical protein